MDQLENVILAIDKVHTQPQKALYSRQGLYGLIYGPNHPTPSA